MAPSFTRAKSASRAKSLVIPTAVRQGRGFVEGALVAAVFFIGVSLQVAVAEFVHEAALHGALLQLFLAGCDGCGKLVKAAQTGGALFGKALDIRLPEPEIRRTPGVLAHTQTRGVELVLKTRKAQAFGGQGAFRLGQGEFRLVFEALAVVQDLLQTEAKGRHGQLQKMVAEDFSKIRARCGGMPGFLEGYRDQRLGGEKSAGSGAVERCRS
jgi:hypothetical protein